MQVCQLLASLYFTPLLSTNHFIYRNAMLAFGRVRLGKPPTRQRQRVAVGGPDHCLQLWSGAMLPLHQPSASTCRGCGLMR